MPAIPKDCTGWEFKSRPEYAFAPGLVLDRHCFSQETPDADIFPEGMVGVTFLNCNLDNCLVPPGNTVVGGSQRRFEAQNDLRDWEVDAKNAPVTVIDEEVWAKKGYSVAVEDIPPAEVLHVDEMRVDVLSGEKTLADVIGTDAAAELVSLREAAVELADGKGVVDIEVFKAADATAEGVK